MFLKIKFIYVIYVILIIKFMLIINLNNYTSSSSKTSLISIFLNYLLNERDFIINFAKKSAKLSFNHKLFHHFRETLLKI